MFILKSTGSDESFVGVIRDLLLEYNQNVDKVVEVIWERRMDDPGYCCIAGNDSGLTAGDNGKPKGQPAVNQSVGENKGGSELSKDTPKAVVESCSQNGDNSNDDGETAKPKTPPNKTGKRVTARERKEIARRKQKENKKLKRQGQHGAKETAHRGGINGITDDIDGSGSVVNQMDRLFI
ncbi:hypothetical protein BKA69DRAFT_489267 [Paraphysoderma sedebokerense]|nr:hypothetical protein BKA69DRAFT_489267 [Paraphysoderma sedebokerense]